MMVLAARRRTMAEHSAIREHMTVVGADGVHVGTVDHLDGDRIKLTKSDSPQAEDGEGARHHYLPAGLGAAVEGDTVWVSAPAANACDPVGGWRGNRRAGGGKWGAGQWPR